MLKSIGTAAAMIVTYHAAFAQSGPGEVRFDLEPNPQFVSCLAPGAPVAHVTVKRGNLNDTLLLRATGLKPNLQFDMFTVQRSPLDANGKPVANFKGFGMAWYQSDIEADENGEAKVLIKTILLDQIFGFDADPYRGPIHRRRYYRQPTRSISAFGLTTRMMPRHAGSMSTSQRRSMANITPARWR